MPIDPLREIEDLVAFEGRWPGTDAERRAAAHLVGRLEALGREAETEPTSIYPSYPVTHAIHAFIAIVGRNNPTGATAPLAFYDRLAGLAARYDFALASDEAYTELWFDEPAASALQARDRSRVIAFQTLSKRSSMTGYRSGFVAAAPDVIAALKAYRPTVGTAPQEFVQRASIVAWDDEEHVERTRETYRRKRELLVPVLERKGYRIAGGNATMYLWVAVPGGASADDAARRLLEHGVVVSPGTFFGPSGAGYLRIALVPTEAECRRAAEILEAVL